MPVPDCILMGPSTPSVRISILTAYQMMLAAEIGISTGSKVSQRGKNAVAIPLLAGPNRTSRTNVGTAGGIPTKQDMKMLFASLT